MSTKKAAPSDPSWQKAAAFAATHHGHRLSADGTPYFAHPVRVALAVLALFRCDDAEVVAAALLHDVIEKAGVTYDDIAGEFGVRVAGMVAALSKDYRLPSPEAAKQFHAQLGAADWKIRLIKLADVYDNLCNAGPARAGRRRKAQKALTLAVGSEPPIVLARQVLMAAIAAAGKTKAAAGKTKAAG